MNDPQPTPDQCEANQTVSSDEHRLTFATFAYPQMGGYCARSFIETGGLGSCFDAEIWHDGEFPFDGGRAPSTLHHCNPLQFVQFGTLVLEKQAEQGSVSPECHPPQTPAVVAEHIDRALQRLQALRDRLAARDDTPESGAEATRRDAQV